MNRREAIIRSMFAPLLAKAAVTEEVIEKKALILKNTPVSFNEQDHMQREALYVLESEFEFQGDVSENFTSQKSWASHFRQKQRRALYHERAKKSRIRYRAFSELRRLLAVDDGNFPNAF